MTATRTVRDWLGRCLILASLLLVAAACSGSYTVNDSREQPPAAAPPGGTQPEATAVLPPVGNGVGDLAPEFSVTTIDGRVASLTDFRQAGQPLVVYFFASW